MTKKKTTSKIEIEAEEKTAPKIEEDTVGKQMVQSKSQPAQSKNQANQSGT